jgi:hypothetical protein
MDEPKRRWFRFSLRTMFLVCTVVAVWLGWNVHLVRQRRAFIENLPERSVFRIRANVFREMPVPPPQSVRDALERQFFEWAIDDVFLWPSKDHRDPFSHRLPSTTFQPSAPRELNWLRQWLGDQPYSLIAYFPGPAAERARALFPEAVIMVADEPWPEWTGSRARE